MGVPVFQRKTSEAKFVYNAFNLDCWANSEGSDWSLRKRSLRDRVIRLADDIYEFVDVGNETEKSDVAHREERIEYFEKAKRLCNHLKHKLAVAEQVVHESKKGKKLSESYWNTWLTYVDEEVALLIGVLRKETKEKNELISQEPTKSERKQQGKVV